MAVELRQKLRTAAALTLAERRTLGAGARAAARGLAGGEGRLLLAAGAILTAAWLALAAIYIGAEIGLSGLGAAAPHELGAIVAGIFAPPAFLWLVLLFLAQARDRRAGAPMLAADGEAPGHPGESVGVREMTAALRAQAQALDEATEHAGSQGRALEEAGMRAAAQADAIGAALGRLARELVQAADQANAQVEAIGSALRRQGEQLAQSADRALGQTERIRDRLREEAQELQRISERVAAQARSAEMALQHQTRDLAAATDDAEARVEKLAVGWRREADVLRERTELAAEKMRSLGAQLGEQATALAGSHGQLAERTRALTGALRVQSDELKAGSNEAADRIADARERLAQEVLDLAQAVGRIDAETRAIAERFQAQSASLSVAAREAAAEVERIAEAGRHARRDSFLQASKTVRDELGSIAVDLGRVLERAPPRNAMRRYQEGDRGIFVRNVLGLRDASLVPMVRDRYAESGEFRRAVDTYIARFQELLDEADRADNEGLLSATFLTSDVGKLYMVLARSIGRLN